MADGEWRWTHLVAGVASDGADSAAHIALDLLDGGVDSGRLLFVRHGD